MNIKNNSQDQWEALAPMIVVRVEKIHGQAKSLADFLRTALKESIRIKGAEIQIATASHKQVRLALRKFLHWSGLDDYRIVSSAGVFQLLLPEKPHRQGSSGNVDAGAGISPFSPYRMNPISAVEFPNYSPVPVRKFRTPKKK